MTPGCFDRWVAWQRLEDEERPDPWPRVIEILRLGLAAIASGVLGATIFPDDIDPMKPKPKRRHGRGGEYLSPTAAAQAAKAML